jgi:Ran GTPase-activating protein (RanGAP) involved in mRNA processing and transport
VNKVGALVLGANIHHASLAGATLRNFNISGNDLGKSGAMKLAKNLALIDIESVNFSKCKLGVGGAKGIQTLINSSSTLKHLFVSGNKFMVEGARLIAEGIEETKSLELIDLSSNLI